MPFVSPVDPERLEQTLDELAKTAQCPLYRLPDNTSGLALANLTASYNSERLPEEITLTFETPKAATVNKSLDLTSGSPKAPIRFLPFNLISQDRNRLVSAFWKYGPQNAEKALSSEPQISDYSFSSSGTVFSGQILFWGHSTEFCLLRFFSTSTILSGLAHNLSLEIKDVLGQLVAVQPTGG